tara:strand:- start:583 stop:1347 length:765 start_codon:yes stop_codon:yes gene_type:complete
MTQQNQPITDPAMKEALLNQMTNSVRDGQTPLRHFKGRCVDIEPTQQQRTYDGETRNSLALKYKFTEVEVFASVTPYPFATGEFTLYNNNPQEAPSPSTPYGIWSGSIGSIIGTDSKVPAIIGKVLEVKYTDGHSMFRRNAETGNFDEISGSAFEVLSIDGQVSMVGGAAGPAGSSSAAAPTGVSDEDIIAKLVELADGKNASDFVSAALVDDVVKASAVFSSILQDQGAAQVAALVATNKINIDAEGVLHKVA